MELSIRKSDLKAAFICSASKDIRYYLQGVYLEFSPHANGVANDGTLTFAGTDGHIMFAGTAPAVFTDDPQTAPFWMIIPGDAVKAALKVKADLIVIKSLADGRYTIGDTVFAPVDAKYPDFRRVIPEKVSGDKGDFDPDLVLRGNDALSEYFHSTKKVYRLNHNGTGAAVMCGDSRDAVVVVMPIACKGMEYTGHDIPAMPTVISDIRKAA